VNAGSRNTLSVFIPGSQGVLPAFQGMIFCLLAFVGFEASAPLGEEAREPRRTIPRAVIWSTIVVGAFYVFNYYAATVFFGPDQMTGFYTSHDGDPWGFMAEQVLPGIGGLLVVFAILNSSLANANAGATAATRSLFAMGRASLLPRFFAAVDPKTRAPINAVHFQAVTAIVIAVVLGIVLANDPYPTADGAASLGGLNVYVFLGTMLGLIFAGIYILVNLACIGYFLRERRDEFNVVKHLVVPVIGVVAMIPALLSVIGGVTIPILDITLDPYTTSLKWTAPIVGAWVVLGILVYIGLWAMNRPALARVGEVYGGEATPDEEASF
jgi:amino acid transporter